MSSYLEDAIEESLRTHGYEDNDGQLEALQRQVETLQMVLARVATLLVENDLMGLRELTGPEHPEEQHFRVKRSGA